MPAPKRRSSTAPTKARMAPISTFTTATIASARVLASASVSTTSARRTRERPQRKRGMADQDFTHQRQEGVRLAGRGLREQPHAGDEARQGRRRRCPGGACASTGQLQELLQFGRCADDGRHARCSAHRLQQPARGKRRPRSPSASLAKLPRARPAPVRALPVRIRRAGAPATPDRCPARGCAPAGRRSACTGPASPRSCEAPGRRMPDCKGGRSKVHALLQYQRR
jgi:hypothetical protein